MKTMQAAGQWWSGIRIGSRLALAFGAVLVLAAVLGAVSLYALSSLNHASDHLALKWLPGVGHIAKTRATMIEARALEVKLATASDSGYVDDYESQLKEVFKLRSETLAPYLALDKSPEEAPLLETIQKSWAAHEVQYNKVLTLAKAGSMADAKDIDDGAGLSSFEEALLAVDKALALQFESASAAAEQSHNVYHQARGLMLGLLATALAAGLVLAVVITRGLLRQLGGEPQEAVHVARAVAGGDLGTRIVLRPGDQTSLMAGLKNMQDSLAQVVKAVRSGSEQVATASAEIATGNNDLSVRTEQQASSLQQAAASMDQLGTTVSQNADNARQADNLARSASEVAQRGGAAVTEVVGTMREINNSSKRIADITGVIDGIAFQTNILALNAAVEAARAGEQGRGFAVVAGEVRSLAQRSAEAAREIKSLIAASVERVEQGTRQVDQAGETMTEVVSSIQRVTQIMNEISAASAEQSAGVRLVGESVTQMDRGTQQNAALVEQSAAAAESLREQAGELVRSVAVFRF
jgi:methyl-accepting chemotaxis protein